MDVSSIVIYGVPVVVLAQIIVGIVKGYYTAMSAKSETLAKAILVVGGYLLSMNLPAVETWWPGATEVLPQVVGSLLILGSFLGVTGKVGVAAKRVSAKLRGK